MQPPAVDRTGKLAFVPARFGPDIIGGAEIVLRQLALGLQDRGWDVEVLTTAALDYFSWKNELPVGVAVEDGLTVRRFEAVKSTAGRERQDIGMRMFAGETIPLGEQERWMNDDVRIPGLYSHLLAHGSEYRAIVFGPYLFWPSVACSQVHPTRSVLWTCLHDEPYAYQSIFKPVLGGVAGLFFQTEPEHELAHSIFSELAPHDTVGCGVEVPDGYDPQRFRTKFGIDAPFLLYAGRREGAKGWDELLQMFARSVVARDLPFHLVTMGAGDVRPPAEVADRVHDVGFLSVEDRNDAYAAAAAYVQPSRYEAFSRTIMESWLAESPVIGVGQGGVVRYHIERSRAGVVYDDAFEFEEALVFLAQQPEAARQLGRAGRQYVLDNYQWHDVLTRVETSLMAWTPAVGTPAAAAVGAA
ncbi:MAG TPA: glycosyltransferase family 4 protein [Blastococcus sp.]|nr:glycosyltransferase family 4 protein [Blastococcus sp.]